MKIRSRMGRWKESVQEISRDRVHLDVDEDHNNVYLETESHGYAHHQLAGLVNETNFLG